MTQAEIEAELISQRQQLLQMQQQLKRRKKDRRRLAQIIGGMGVLFAATSIIIALVDLFVGNAHHPPASFSSELFFTALPLIFLAIALADGQSPWATERSDGP
jgi:hypothetical protein